MNDLASINCLAETTYQGPFPSMSKLVVLTPSRPPPLPSSIPTRCMGTSFMKVLNVITQKQAALTTAPVQGTKTSAAVHSSIHSQSLDNLTFHYGQSTSQPGLHPFPIQPEKATPIFIKRQAITAEQIRQEARFNSGNEPYSIPRKSTVNVLGAVSKDTHGKARVLSSHKVSVLKSNHESSTDAVVPGIHRSFKQTTIVAEKNSGNLKLQFAVSEPIKCTMSTTKGDDQSRATRQPKKEESCTYPEQTNTKLTAGKLKDVRGMTADDRKQLAVQFSLIEEVALCLVYKDGSTQLRPKMVKGKMGKAQCEVDGLCMAFPVKGRQAKSTTLHYVFLPLNKEDDGIHTWCRDHLLPVMRRARMITYGGQRIASRIISCFELHKAKEWLQWTLLDIDVGGWLLNPDHPSNTFTQLLSRFDMQPTTSNKTTEVKTLISADMSLMGPAMVKVYQTLQKENLWTLFEKVEVKLIPILAAMEVRGIQVNCKKLIKCGESLKTKIVKVEELAHKAAGHKFSINSTVQLRQILFDELCLDGMCSKKLSKTHVYKQKSTSEAVLTQLQEFHPLPGLVLKYRQLCKMNATYINGIMPYISEDILKASWVQTGTATGRLVSCNPNIQAFPKQSVNLGVIKEQFIIGKAPEEVTIDLRDAVESRLGYTFLAADFKSIELRIVAHFSEDELLISTLKEATDVFVHLASRWLGVDVDKVTQVHRERTKRVVYAVIYGVGKERLGEILNVQPSYAKDLTNSFLAKFPGVQAFITKTIEECRNKGFLETVCGRRRWLPDINASNVQLRLQSERQAVNFLVQGSAADICKCGMLDISRLLAMEHPETRLLLQIHDEMLFEVPDTELKEVAGKLKLKLESASILQCPLQVPLEVRITSGKTWASLKTLSD